MKIIFSVYVIQATGNFTYLLLCIDIDLDGKPFSCIHKDICMINKKTT